MLKSIIEDEVRRLINGDQNEQAIHDTGSRHKIVIAQRGFVFAGQCWLEGDYVVLYDAVNIRRWGTTKGLGELAEKGNLPETQSDPCGTVRLHKLAVIAMIDCEAKINATV